MAKRVEIEPTWRDIAAAELKIPSESAKKDLETDRASRVYALAKARAHRRANDTVVAQQLWKRRKPLAR